MITVQQIINTPVPSNCFVVYDKAVGKDCVVVDPGSKSDEGLFSFIEQNGLTPQCIILTHEHFDHCWGVNELVARYNIPIICSEACSEAIRSEKRNCSVFYDNKERFVITTKTISVESLDYVLFLNGLKFCFFSSPGHTEASICFTSGNYLFTGDTLIYGVKTVTKLPTGSLDKLNKTLSYIDLFKGKNYTVCAGHGDCFKLEDV